MAKLLNTLWGKWNDLIAARIIGERLFNILLGQTERDSFVICDRFVFCN